MQALEAIAENDEALMEKYLGGEELSQDEIYAVLGRAVAAGEAFPVLCGSATKNIGIPALLDLIVGTFPPPRPFAVGGQTARQGRGGGTQSASDAPFSAVVFKTSSAFAGTLTMMRVLSGKLGADTNAYNPNTNTYERLSGLVKINGKSTESTEGADAGDIVGIAKLKQTHTGNTLCDEKNQVIYSLIEIPEPSISFSVHPKGKGDEDKIIGGLIKIAEDDPTLRVTEGGADA
ncbi:MAG: EF-Tu/IF-2/RF-3 family GTPase [Deltaproteobacteria bacterium]|nr:EF-Tu/IF-2/RF-3 family GTPase [Deltaproteobacteria bacterium]